jgi:hypothetical protein
VKEGAQQPSTTGDRPLPEESAEPHLTSSNPKSLYDFDNVGILSPQHLELDLQRLPVYLQRLLVLALSAPLLLTTVYTWVPSGTNGVPNSCYEGCP